MTGSYEKFWEMGIRACTRGKVMGNEGDRSVGVEAWGLCEGMKKGGKVFGSKK